MDAPTIVPSFASAALPFAPFCTLWIPSSARLLALGCRQDGSASLGALHLYKLEMPADDSGQLRLMLDAAKQAGGTKKTTTGLSRAGLKCGTFDLSTPSGRLLAVGDFEGRVSVWDVERLQGERPLQTLFTIEGGHDQIVNSIDATPHLLLTGSRDGRACVWDVRQRGKPTAAVAELAFPESDCWAVTFSGASQEGFFAGYDDGRVYMAELRMNAQPRWQHHLARSSGICSLDCHDGKLVATTVDDHFTLFDLDLTAPARGPELKREVKGRPTLRPPEAMDATTWDARFSPHNRDYFMTAGGNGYLDLYKTGSAAGGHAWNLQSVATVAAGTQPILSFAWNQAKEGLFAFASLDSSLHVGFVPTPLR
ncbi:monad, putative [Acanthamoeba castellanii str. Neff]|uniref:Monad, putative n=1 Tax=Acanthamoeba castellanii (strain ATCC 30010 / Neff) TaxID=1257118 RepID=L8GM70_ACACF|nr:monad, putative [Acanthamoeba castellanii str. Neff]ELR13321.1 monad, putative [Acanthamoeba castellanii str. Neff]